MNWNYEEKLIEYIAQAKRDSGLGDDYIFEVCTEQIFAKLSTLTPNTIYVVVKYLSSTNSLNSVIQPIQLIISCEQNQIQTSQIIFSKLVEQHNFEAIIENGTYVKQDYREPVVLSNFNEVSYGYRTIMYISATLLIMEDVADVEDLSITVQDTILLNPTVSSSVINDYFIHGNRTDKPSDVFYVDKTALLNKYSTLTDPPSRIKISMDDNGETVMKFENRTIRSFEVNFVSQIIQTVNETGGTRNYFLSQIDGFILQFLPASENVEITYTNEEAFLAVFNNLINKRQIGGLTEYLKPIDFSIVYAMTPNTQPIPPAKIATSVKSVATFAISFSVPLTTSYNFIEVIEYIMNGTMTGNCAFVLTFKLGLVRFSNVSMKLTNAQVTTAINQVPGLQIGMIK